MAETGYICGTNDKHMTLKRKRDSTNDEVDHMPPMKVAASLEKELSDQPAHNVVVESSSSDEETSPYNNHEYASEYAFSPPSISELQNCILSPLENVNRGDSTPHTNKRPSTSKSECPTLPKRKCPLPWLSWADSTDVWESMCESDERASLKRSHNMFDQHPALQLRMRAILLDWLNEVCEVNKLHRETFHLAVDYIDRYLTETEDVYKGRLQLVGITCLFIAAKVEEVYPPKIGEFSYVTDNACSADDILMEEFLILKILSWNLMPLTINSWLNVYMQLASEGRSAKRRLLSESDVGANALRGYTFVFLQYSSLEFVICGQLVDLAVLHVDVNKFSYSVVAAAAMAHTFNKELAIRVSGYCWEALEPCWRWLQPFVSVVRATGAVTVVRGADGEYVRRAAGLDHICPGVNLDESHHIQSHNVSLDMFDDVSQLLEQQESSHTDETEIELTTVIETHLHEHVYPPTPPQSNPKCPKTPTTKTPSTKQSTILDTL